MARIRVSAATAFIWAVVALALHPPVGALQPQVTVTLDTMSTTVGEPILLSLQLHFDSWWRPLLPVPPPQLPFDGRLVGAGSSSDPGKAASESAATARWQVVAYETGEYELPVIPVSFVSARGDTLVAASNSVKITVIPVRADGDAEPRDIKPPQFISGGVPLWVVAVLVALALVGLAVLVRHLRQRPLSEIPVPMPPPVDYVREFARIAQMGLVQRGALKLHYSLLSETLRQFLGDRLVIAAPDLTTTEITAELEPILEPALVAEIDRYLSTADMVKFAKAIPVQDVSLAAPEIGSQIVVRVTTSIEALVEETDQAAAAEVAE